jgi:hypothetical protein
VRYALAVPLLVFVYFGISQKPIEAKYRQFSILNQFQGITVSHPDWIDRAVGRNADVSMIWSGNTDRFSLWENEFFNRSLKRFYYTSAPLTDETVDIGGRVVARDKLKHIVLLQIDGPLRQVSRVEGLYPQDTWSGRTATYTRLGCRGGTVVATLQSDPGLFTKPTTVTAFVNGREVARTRVAPTATRLLRVPLARKGEACSVTFTVSPTAVPNIVTKGQNPDPRVLGTHFTRFQYRP